MLLWVGIQLEDRRLSLRSIDRLYYFCLKAGNTQIAEVFYKPFQNLVEIGEQLLAPPRFLRFHCMPVGDFHELITFLLLHPWNYVRCCINSSDTIADEGAGHFYRFNDGRVWGDVR